MELARVPIESMKGSRLLVLSLGTGFQKLQDKHDATKSSGWGIIGWLKKGRSKPLMDAFTQADSEMTNYFVSALFQALDSNEYYLRIQVHFFHFISTLYFA